MAFLSCGSSYSRTLGRGEEIKPYFHGSGTILGSEIFHTRAQPLWASVFFSFKWGQYLSHRVVMIQSLTQLGLGIAVNRQLGKFC